MWLFANIWDAGKYEYWNNLSAYRSYQYTCTFDYYIYISILTSFLARPFYESKVNAFSSTNCLHIPYFYLRINQIKDVNHFCAKREHAIYFKLT